MAHALGSDRIGGAHDPGLGRRLSCARRRAMSAKDIFRTPLSRVRSLGSAHSGTMHFWRQRLTSVALIPLSIAFVLIVIALLGGSHATALQILGSPLIAIIMLLFVGTTVYHMWLGMQVIIEDYVHDELP